MLNRQDRIHQAGLTLWAACLVAYAALGPLGIPVSAAPTSEVGASAAFVGLNGETYLLGSDGTARMLTAYPTNAAGGGGLALDSTGTTIATTRPHETRSEVVLVSAADGSVKAVPGTRERNCALPRFHPDGVHLLAICDPRQDRFARSVDLFERDTGYVRTLAQGGVGGIEFMISGVVVAPDGAWAIVQEHLGDYAVRHWRLDLTSGQIEPLVVPGLPYAVRVEVFLADGRILATRCEACLGTGPRSASEIVTDILILGAGDQGEVVLHSVPDLVASPALSPDGTTLLYSTANGSGPALWDLDRSTNSVQRIGSGGMATYPQPASGAGVVDRSSHRSSEDSNGILKFSQRDCSHAAGRGLLGSTQDRKEVHGIGSAYGHPGHCCGAVPDQLVGSSARGLTRSEAMVLSAGGDKG
jgi:hypothetical protein